MKSTGDPRTAKHVHFIGIGGIGMSALARLLVHEKKTVTGSDRSRSEVTEGLEALGITVHYGQKPENLREDTDLVIYSDAVSKGSEGYTELLAARQNGIATLSYFEALGVIANQYYLIAVSGTHGKTTTTAMIADVLEAANLDPTVVVGSLRTKTKSNFRAGKHKYFVVEADEYMRHFLVFEPDILVITNIEADHLDYYSDLAAVQSAFRSLVDRVREGGVIVTDTADKNIEAVLDRTDRKIVNYSSFIDPLMQLKVFGAHNYKNAGATLAVANELKIEKQIAVSALQEFTGTWRRFEYKGEMHNGAMVYDDYAHHPTEILATLSGARDKHPDKKITVVFQPHLFSRTKDLFSEFTHALAKADRVILYDIYPAREVDDGSVSSAMLADAVRKENPETMYLSSFEKIAEHLAVSASKEDVVVIMGAGDITNVAKILTENT